MAYAIAILFTVWIENNLLYYFFPFALETFICFCYTFFDAFNCRVFIYFVVLLTERKRKNSTARGCLNINLRHLIAIVYSFISQWCILIVTHTMTVSILVEYLLKATNNKHISKSNHYLQSHRKSLMIIKSKRNQIALSSNNKTFFSEIWGVFSCVGFISNQIIHWAK